jgi:oligosaccharyltransferase complex subunit alpha (ribophorin I)
MLVNDGPKSVESFLVFWITLTHVLYCRLEGQFSRLVHQANLFAKRTTGLAHVITGLHLRLPSVATAPYYVDTVGNVSTSRFRPAPNALRASQLEIAPRYPLMGGWKYNFTVGYSAPLKPFVKRKGWGEYVLSVPFMTPVKDVAVDEVTVRVRLPEGAR